jgi:hypothetical protein
MVHCCNADVRKTLESTWKVKQLQKRYCHNFKEKGKEGVLRMQYTSRKLLNVYPWVASGLNSCQMSSNVWIRIRILNDIKNLLKTCLNFFLHVIHFPGTAPKISRTLWLMTDGCWQPSGEDPKKVAAKQLIKWLSLIVQQCSTHWHICLMVAKST